ncbi:uncharacterized protein FIESC28_11056 [Fusarium coffeatum]|uniref:Cytochrome P450 n=1 Tax=Fusarium coffeatum TaxID=231269 RepID=A0A366QNH4_9HYPO|nr:uncharacterized protein FIESC28_11056 [Fusarium coffeatum]RBR06433.1 hypothetical protein FIESC28_11056 [Fusarium coffeatum]
MIEQFCLALFFVVLLLFWARHSQPKLPLPPGPPSEFLLGHTRVIPQENAAKVYSRWSKEYISKDSDIIHVRSLGRSTIVLHSAELAKDILEKKGANFSDRPRFTLLEVMGWGKTLTFLPFGKCWQMHRKFLQTSFSNTSVRKWHELQRNEAHHTVKDIIETPDTWEKSLRRFAVAIVLQVSYGTKVTSDDDPYIRIANDAMYATGNGGVPANSVVDLVPLVRYLPDWLIRDWSLRFARQWQWAITKLHDVPFAAALAEHGCEQDWTLDDIKGAAGAVFIAGTDTTWATCVIFILNMVLHPEIQKKAQAELDAVIGSGKLPRFSDRPLLPYIEHIVQETYRVRTLFFDTITIVVHVYEVGKVLTKLRTVVYANAYAIAHDERVYKNPQDFNPDRYGGGEPYPIGNFGFGRRYVLDQR